MPTYVYETTDPTKPVRRFEIVAAKAMAYIQRRDFDRAREIVEANRWGTTSLGQELETVKRLIRQETGNE